MEVFQGFIRVRFFILSYEMIRSYCEVFCWYFKQDVTENSSIMKIQFVSFCLWELEFLREYLEVFVYIKGVEGFRNIFED